jgi:hypothetical protein
MNYTYTIDLRNQDTTPSYVVSYVLNGATITYPANIMPHLNKGDVLTFNFQTDKDVSVASSNLYVRAIIPGEMNSPFEPQDQDNSKYPISQGLSLNVVADNGSWTFSILGFINVPNLAGSGTIQTPFFIDPEAEVGTGYPP